MNKLPLILLATLSLSLAINASGEIEVKYDKSKDMTIVRTKTGSVSAAPTSPGIIWIGWYTGTIIIVPKQVILKFVSRSRDWYYLGCHEVYCLANGKVVEFPQSRHYGSIYRGGVLEQISVIISFETAIQIAFAKKVEFKICDTEFQMSKYDHEDAQIFIGKFEK